MTSVENFMAKVNTPDFFLIFFNLKMNEIALWTKAKSLKPVAICSSGGLEA